MKITMADGSLVENYVYFSNVSSNGLFKISTNTEKIEFVGFFPEERVDARFLHKRCFAYENKLFFLPAYSRYIAVYDIFTETFTRLPFMNNTEGEAILDAVKMGKFIYVFPRNEKCIPIILDMETMDLSSVLGFDIWIDKYVSHNNPEKFYRVACNGDSIYFGLCETDIIAEWNISTNNFKTFKTGMQKIINVFAVRDICFFTLREKYGVGKLNLKDGNIEYIECAKNNNADVNLYGCLFPIEDGIGAAPAYGKYLHCFNQVECSYEYKIEDKISDEYKFYRYIIVGSDVWLLPLVIEELYILRKGFKVHKIELTYDDQEKFKTALIEDSLSNDSFITENHDLKLTDFVSFVSGIRKN